MYTCISNYMSDNLLALFQACSKSCYQLGLVNNCSCGDPTLPLTSDAYHKPVLPCDPVNETQSKKHFLKK